MRSSAGRAPFSSTIAILLDVTLVDTDIVSLHFSHAVTVDDGITPDGEFHCTDQVPASVTLTDATHVWLDMGSALSPGSAWELDGQPNWLITPVTSPASGTIA